MSNASTSRHARERRQHSGGLRRAVLPTALGAALAGSVLLATAAVAAPVADQSPATHHDGGSSSSLSPGDYGSWSTRDGWRAPDGRHSRDGSGQYPWWHNGDRRQSYDRSHPRNGGPRYYGSHSPAARQSRPAASHHASRPAARPAAATEVAATEVATAGARNAGASTRSAATGSGTRAAGAAGARQARSEHVIVPDTNRTAPRRVSSSARADLAAVDTARADTDYVRLYGAIGGTALVALLAMGGVALWRRRDGQGAQP